jgi:hypothetical protein
MRARTAFALGLAYGISVGMAARGLLDYAEALAHQVRRPPAPQPVPITLHGRNLEAAINHHRRATGRERLP